MKARNLLTAAVVAVLALGGLARTGWAVTYAGSGFAIANLATQTDTIVVPDSALITDVTVSLVDLTHTFIGDLIVTLTHVDTATTVDLFRRVGQLNNTGFGDSSNLDGDYNFNDAFAGDLWATAAGSGGNDVIPGADYFPSSNDGVGESASSFAPFFGQNTLGSWTLSVRDEEAGDTGNLASWSLSFEVQRNGNNNHGAIPEPVTATLGLLSLSAVGLALGRRRRA